MFATVGVKCVLVFFTRAAETPSAMKPMRGVGSLSYIFTHNVSCVFSCVESLEARHVTKNQGAGPPEEERGYSVFLFLSRGAGVDVVKEFKYLGGDIVN